MHMRKQVRHTHARARGHTHASTHYFITKKNGCKTHMNTYY